MSHPAKSPRAPKAWEGVIRMPVAGPHHDPRTSGLTMVIDKSLGPRQLERSARPGRRLHRRDQADVRDVGVL